MGKKELTAIFSSDPDRYYKVSLFDRLGFKRQRCNNCGKFFWSLNDKQVCPDHQYYGFIGEPPTNKRLDYINAWKEIEEYFQSNAHSIIRRYPVVCRWRDDLYFTIASIVDFQRVIGDKVIFELPTNPLIVPQMCLRFNDIENVGLSGRHYTSFCMIGQVCNADAQGGYWKDKCIELDYRMLTNALGIRKEEITFVEDVWMGAGAFGYSLEYFVSGLELGNAVFTEFEGNENDYRVMTNKIIDMGAGLERLSWITMGTPTSYDCSFGPVVRKLVDNSGTSESPEILSKYFTAVSTKLDYMSGDIHALKSLVAKELKISDDLLTKMTAPYEAIYTIADHTRTLVFAISDGALPSNVGGGYNLRVILRRALSILERLGWNMKLEDIADMHIDYVKHMYPELEEHREDVRTILQIESGRYIGSRERMEAIANSIKSTEKKLMVDDLIRMYESDGVTPDFLVDLGAIDSIPPTFYTKLAELHTSQAAAQAQKSIYGLDGVAPTRLLYYEDKSIREFSAKILKVIDKKFIILDQTAFYPRGGGQEPDTGEIDGVKVLEVIKQADIVVHKLQGPSDFIDGKTVHGTVNDRRRELITQHHTATHVLNTSARFNLGSWVWQNSAFKEENYARLDVTHHSSLNREEVERIEKTANNVIRQNLPVKIKIYDRVDAEQDYTFRIYQGGVVPTSNIRIVNIENWDIEACGGTHVSTTGEIGLIKIIKSERIQDGVVRLEFVAGEAAMNYIQKQENQLTMIAQSLGSSKEKVVESLQKSIDEAEAAKKKVKTLLRKITPSIAKSVSEEAKQLSSDGIKFYHVRDNEMDEEYHISVGEKSIESDPSLIYVAFISKGEGIRVIVFVGEQAQKKIKAASIARQISVQLGGSGGGDSRFGQGGGRFKDKISTALVSVEELVLKSGM
ncbi:MAG: alanine--tRNA ligase [Candidatus Nitrosopolaris sp.]